MSQQEARRPEQQLSSDVFRLLVKSVRDYAIFLLDPTGHILTWNEGAQRIKGYEAGDIIGRHFSTFYPTAEIRSGKPEYELRVAVDEGRFEDEGWRLRKDGTRFWANVIITALFDESGQHVGFAKVTRDLTERRQAEQERAQLLMLERQARAEAEAAVERLRALQSLTEAALAYLDTDHLLSELLQRITALLEVDTAAILLTDPDRPDVLVNRAAVGLETDSAMDGSVALSEGFARRVASERRAVVLDDITHIGLPPDSALLQKQVRSLMGVPLMIEGRVLGVLHAGTLHYHRFTDADVQFLQVVADRVALAIDHARLFEAERQARQEAEVTAATLRARDEFLSIAAHELKTPMTSLRTAAQLLLRRVNQGTTPEPAHLLQALNTVEGQIIRLSRLVDQLLDTTRLQTRGIELDRSQTDLTALVEHSVAQARLRDNQHTIQFAAEGALWADIDALRIEQILTNLLENAIKYSPAGTLIEVMVVPADINTVQITVRDHGVGVPPQHRAHIFERFYQAHAESYRSGMGLGLYISREIAERHGGDIRAEFPDDGGTRFVVTLPLKPVTLVPQEQGGVGGAA